MGSVTEDSLLKSNWIGRSIFIWSSLSAGIYFYFFASSLEKASDKVFELMAMWLLQSKIPQEEIRQAAEADFNGIGSSKDDPNSQFSSRIVFCFGLCKDSSLRRSRETEQTVKNDSCQISNLLRRPFFKPNVALPSNRRWYDKAEERKWRDHNLFLPKWQKKADSTEVSLTKVTQSTALKEWTKAMERYGVEKLCITLISSGDSKLLMWHAEQSPDQLKLTPPSGRFVCPL